MIAYNHFSFLFSPHEPLIWIPEFFVTIKEMKMKELCHLVSNHLNMRLDIYSLTLSLLSVSGLLTKSKTPFLFWRHRLPPKLTLVKEFLNLKNHSFLGEKQFDQNILGIFFVFSRNACQKLFLCKCRFWRRFSSISFYAQIKTDPMSTNEARLATLNCLLNGCFV